MRLTRPRIGAALLAAAFCLGLYFLWMVRAGLYPFFLGILLAYLLNPFVVVLERQGLTRGWALSLIYVVIGSLFVGVGVKFLPVLIRELESFGGELPAMLQRVEELLQYWQAGYQSWVLPLSMKAAVDEGLRQIGGQLNAFVTGAVQRILDGFTYLIGIAVSPVLAFYILYDWKKIQHQLLTIVPSAGRAETVAICRSVNRVLHGVIRGQFFVSLLVGTVITVGLSLLGIRYALLIGILAGILDVIPYFGAIIGALPALGVAFLYTPLTAIQVGALFFAVHQTESMFIQPKIVGNTVGLHPLSVIFFVFVGGEVGGLAGMLLAVPAAAIGKVLLQHALKLFV